MKVVDKYELAKEPWGTPFYCLTKDGIINNCGGTLFILESNTFYRHTDNNPMFNGVYVELDVFMGDVMRRFTRYKQED